MTASNARIRKARKEHQCTEQSWHKIKAGQHYYSVVCVPWHDVGNGKTFQVIRACLPCAIRYGLMNSELREKAEAIVMTPSVP